MYMYIVIVGLHHSADCLLYLQSELGRPLRRGYTDYPGDKWRYGQPNPPSNGGVAEGESIMSSK